MKSQLSYVPSYNTGNTQVCEIKERSVKPFGHQDKVDYFPITADPKVVSLSYATVTYKH